MRLMIVLSRLFLAVITINLGFIVRQLTNGSRGIVNAWRLWCKIEVQCLSVFFEFGYALSTP